MGVTISINKMTASHKGSGGISTAFPDVCKTPAPPAPFVPIPYPNIAMSGDLTKGSKKVKFDKKPVCLKNSKLKTSTGDEAGTLKGIVSQKIKGKAQFQAYSFDVKVEGKNVCRLADPTSQNMASINTAAFFHAQKPLPPDHSDAQLVKEACDEMKKKMDKQKDDKQPERIANSGIIGRHITAIRKTLDRLKIYTVFFRKTNPLSGRWIDRGHQPKPHSCTAGSTIKGDFVEEVRQWLKAHPGTPEHELAVGKADNITGVVMLTSEAVRGKPRLADSPEKRAWTTGARGKGANAGHKPQWWTTGDYDMMDVQKVGAACERATEEEFNILKMNLNEAMGWDGIQHPPQSAWDTLKDDGFKQARKDGLPDFNVEQILAGWGKQPKDKAVADIPARVIASGRKPLSLVDNALSVFAPQTSVYLDEHGDFWDALACCGCRKDEQEQAEPQETK